MALQGRPLGNLIDVAAQPLRFAPSPHETTCGVEGVLPDPSGHHLLLLGQLPMKALRRILADSPATLTWSCENRAARQAVLRDTELVLQGEIRDTLQIAAATPQRTRARSSIFQVSQYLPSRDLALDCFLELFMKKRLPLRIGPIRPGSRTQSTGRQHHPRLTQRQVRSGDLAAGGPRRCNGLDGVGA